MDKKKFVDQITKTAIEDYGMRSDFEPVLREWLETCPLDDAGEFLLWLDHSRMYPKKYKDFPG